MNKNLFKLITLGCIVSLSLIVTSAKGQELWSLDKCINHALENNIQIQQQQLNVNYADNLLDLAKFSRLPNLNASTSYKFNLGRTLSGLNTFTDKSSSSLQLGINSEVTVFNGMLISNTIKKRRFNQEAALNDLQKAKDDISLRVVSAYLEILFNKELLATSKEQLELTKQQIEYNKKQIEVGNVAKGKLLETESQAANEELSVTNYENQLQISILNLVQLLELQTCDNFDIVIPKFNEETLIANLINANMVYEAAVATRPEIKSKEQALKSAEMDNKITQAQKLPSLTAGANYGTSYNNSYTYTAFDPILEKTYDTGEKIPLGEQFDNYRSGAIYLSLNIPIYNRHNAKINYKNSLLNYEDAKYGLELEKNNLRKEIQQAHANASAAMKKYYSSEKAVQSATEAFRYVEEKFNLGIVTPLEYNESKNKVTNAQSSFIQAKYEYIFRIKILDFYNGKEITL